MRQNIFITGSAGFFGIRLVKEILTNTSSHLFLLLRPHGREVQKERIERLLSQLIGPAMADSFCRRITVIKGDITKKDLAIASSQLKKLIKQVDLIFHSAAELDIQKASPKISRVNITGTRNVLNFASLCREKGRLKALNHISTAYIIGTAGMQKIRFYEDQLDISQKFNNLYEETKFKAEVIVNQFRNRGLPINVFRPSIMTESFSANNPESFSIFFRPFRFIVSGIFDELPASDDAQYNLISVDDAARAIYIIAKSTRNNTGNYHIVNPKTINLARLLDIAVRVFGMKKPKCKPLESFDMESLTGVQRMLINSFIPYFNFMASFDSSCASALLKKKGFSYYSLKESDIVTALKYIKREKI